MAGWTAGGWTAGGCTAGGWIGGGGTMGWAAGGCVAGGCVVGGWVAATGVPAGAAVQVRSRVSGAQAGRSAPGGKIRATSSGVPPSRMLHTPGGPAKEW